MITIRRSISLFLSAIMLISLLSGCDGHADQSNDIDGGDTMNTVQTSIDGDTSLSPLVQDALEMKHQLQFKENGEFRVLITSDIQDTFPLSTKTREALELLIEKEKPDLVLFGGDNAIGFTEKEKLKEYLEQMVESVESRKIPWAHVYGNHDTEMANALKRKEHQEVYESFEYCVSKAGPEDISGVGNYVLPIYSSDGKKITFNVWGLDSGSYLDYYKNGLKAQAVLPNPLIIDSSYEYIHFDQIKWYWETSAALEKYSGYKIPSIMYFHIPVPEFNAVVKNPSETGKNGHKQEDIWSSELNSGLFTTLIDRGDVLGVYCGHDHYNDFVGTYCGIQLGYTSNIGFGTYHDEKMMGVRMVVINENDPYNFDTYISYLNDTEIFAPKYSDKETLSVTGATFAGTVFDFESVFFEKGGSLTLGNKIKDYYSSGFDCGIERNGATLELANGCGWAKSTALGITKQTDKSNSEFSLYFADSVNISDAEYLRVYVDLTGVDFRKASFGVVDTNGHVFRTDEADGWAEFPKFYTLPDGETKWLEMEHGSDGCFGSGQASSVKNFKGWMAFPISDFIGWQGFEGHTSPFAGKSPIDAGITEIAGVYFYFDLTYESMLGKQFFMDEIGLVKDYSVFK